MTFREPRAGKAGTPLSRSGPEEEEIGSEGPAHKGEVVKCDR